MSIEDQIKPLQNGAELLLQGANEAIAEGDSDRAKELVMSAVRQGLIIRHLKANKKISEEELGRIMIADPEEIYQIFADEEYPKNCVNKEFIRPPIRKERYKPCRGGDFGAHET